MRNTSPTFCPDIQSRRSLTELIKDHATLSGYDFLAREYARAAELYLSPVLVAHAERFQKPTFALSMFVYEQTKAGAIDAYLADIAGPEHRQGSMTPMAREIALAVTKAAIGHDEATIRTADTLTRMRYAARGEQGKYSDLLTFAENAYLDNDDACNPDNLNSIDGYPARCEANGFEEGAFSFWFNRSRLELIAQKAGVGLEPLDIPFSRDGATPMTIDLFVRREWENGDSRYGERTPALEIVRLLVWSADATAKSDSCATLAANDDLQLVYAKLVWAQTLVNPAKNPRAYHLIAKISFATLKLQQLADELTQTPPTSGPCFFRGRS